MLFIKISLSKKLKQSYDNVFLAPQHFAKSFRMATAPTSPTVLATEHAQQ